MTDHRGTTLAGASIAERVSEVRRRIEQACERADRDPASVRLIAVSKTQPVAAIREALEAGIEDFGENRAQELAPKAEEAERLGLRVAWHFVGHLQRNKVRDVMPHVAVLHSLDSPRLIEDIGRRRPEAVAGRAIPHADGALPCYLEVNVSGEAQKHGVAPDQVSALLAAAEASSAVRVSGLMTVAPLVDDPEEVRLVFATLRELARAHGLPGLSMGMTDDFEVAIEEGSTVVRVGRAIFGERTG